MGEWGESRPGCCVALLSWLFFTYAALCVTRRREAGWAAWLFGLHAWWAVGLGAARRGTMWGAMIFSWGLAGLQTPAEARPLRSYIVIPSSAIIFGDYMRGYRACLD